MLIISITAVLALLLQLILPWWSASLVAFLVALSFKQSALKAFINGFSAIFLLWFLIALGIYVYNEGVLAARLALLFSLPGALLTVPVTALVGGLSAGLAALTGNLIRAAIWQSKSGDTNTASSLPEDDSKVSMNHNIATKPMNDSI